MFVHSDTAAEQQNNSGIISRTAKNSEGFDLCSSREIIPWRGWLCVLLHYIRERERGSVAGGKMWKWSNELFITCGEGEINSASGLNHPRSVQINFKINFNCLINHTIVKFTSFRYSTSLCFHLAISSRLAVVWQRYLVRGTKRYNSLLAHLILSWRIYVTESLSVLGMCQ